MDYFEDTDDTGDFSEEAVEEYPAPITDGCDTDRELLISWYYTNKLREIYDDYEGCISNRNNTIADLRVELSVARSRAREFEDNLKELSIVLSEKENQRKVAKQRLWDTEASLRADLESSMLALKQANIDRYNMRIEIETLTTSFTESQIPSKSVCERFLIWLRNLRK